MAAQRRNPLTRPAKRDSRWTCDASSHTIIGKRLLLESVRADDVDALVGTYAEADPPRLVDETDIAKLLSRSVARSIAEWKPLTVFAEGLTIRRADDRSIIGAAGFIQEWNRRSYVFNLWGWTTADQQETTFAVDVVPILMSFAFEHLGAKVLDVTLANTDSEEQDAFRAAGFREYWRDERVFGRASDPTPTISLSASGPATHVCPKVPILVDEGGNRGHTGGRGRSSRTSFEVQPDDR